MPALTEQGCCAHGGDGDGARHPISAGALQPYACPTRQVEDARTMVEMDRITPSKALAQVGDPKQQHADEAELGSGGPTLKHPRMVVSR
jgi:hypothetical protein